MPRRSASPWLPICRIMGFGSGALGAMVGAIVCVALPVVVPPVVVPAFVLAFVGAVSVGVVVFVVLVAEVLLLVPVGWMNEPGMMALDVVAPPELPVTPYGTVTPVPLPVPVLVVAVVPVVVPDDPDTVELVPVVVVLFVLLPTVVEADVSVVCVVVPEGAPSGMAGVCARADPTTASNPTSIPSEMPARLNSVSFFIRLSF